MATTKWWRRSGSACIDARRAFDRAVSVETFRLAWIRLGGENPRYGLGPAFQPADGGKGLHNISGGDSASQEPNRHTLRRSRRHGDRPGLGIGRPPVLLTKPSAT
jgi:hypothetical protein